LLGLSESGVGCYWRWLFAGAFCYADDLVLLAPCASVLRNMCSAYNDDILKGHKDLIRKANSILHIFLSSDPAVLCYLFESLSLSIWVCPMVPIIWVYKGSSNRNKRKMWHLYRTSHTSIVLSVAKINYVQNIVFKHYSCLVLCLLVSLLSTTLCLIVLIHSLVLKSRPSPFSQWSLHKT
jgi:hypothetical protein